MFKSSIEDFPAELSINSDDVSTAYVGVLWAWNDNSPCSQILLCATYIGNFEITFGNGGLGFTGVVQRITTSAHDCIKNAKDALMGQNKDGVNPDRGLAVAWVMASQIHNKPYYEWLKTHGDAVVAALGMIH